MLLRTKYFGLFLPECVLLQGGWRKVFIGAMHNNFAEIKSWF
jgi:hypothetical protein